MAKHHKHSGTFKGRINITIDANVVYHCWHRDIKFGDLSRE